MKSEFDAAGLPWHNAASERIAYLEESLGYLRKHFEDEGIDHPRLLIAGNSDGVLKLAAEHADVVGFGGLRQQPGKPPGTFKLDNAEAMDERVAYFRAHAKGREIEYNMLVQHVEVTDRPAGRGRGVAREDRTQCRRRRPRAPRRAAAAAGHGRGDRRAAGRPAKALRLLVHHGLRAVFRDLRARAERTPRLTHVLSP